MYLLGVILAVSSSIANFMGQILQKKAINDVRTGDDVSMKDVIKKPLWITGLICIVVFTTVLNGFAQNFIGPALIPGLFSSGLIVLAIGSVKILGERLKKEEWLALFMIISGIILVSLSRLSIETDLDRFRDTSFVIRLSVASVMLITLWLTFFYGGKKLKKHKAVIMAIGSGLPFALGNIWMFALVDSLGRLLGGGHNLLNGVVFAISSFIMGTTQILGLVHFNKTLAAGNASIVVPIQQIPQQIMPVITYFVIFALSPPAPVSFFYISGGILLIVTAGFLLGKRHTSQEKNSPAAADTEAQN